MVSGADDGTLRVWNVPTRTTKRTLEGLRKPATGEAMLVLIGHSDCVRSVAFSPDGTRVVSGSSDKTVRIWNVNTGEMERVLEGHTDLVFSVAFSPDGTHVISRTADDVVIWDAFTGQSTPLSCHESFQFPDRSKVTHIFPGKFQLFAPDQEEVLLSPDWTWILTRRQNEACRIPSECRDVKSHAISGSKVCLGCGSGRVVIVDLAPRR